MTRTIHAQVLQKDKRNRVCFVDDLIGSRHECVTKYTSATVSVSSANNTPCPIIDAFVRLPLFDS